MNLNFWTFMRYECKGSSWQIYQEALARFMDLPARPLAFISHERPKIKNHSLNECRAGTTFNIQHSKRFNVVLAQHSTFNIQK